MRQEMDTEVEVAGFGATLSFSLHPDARALDHAGRNLDLDLAARRKYPRPAARRAGHALHHGSITHLAPLSGKARAATRGTSLRHLRLNGALAPARGLLERDLEGVLDVLASLPSDGSTARPLETEAGKPAALAGEVGVEEVAEIAESGGLAGTSARLRLVLASEFLLAFDPLTIGAKLVVLRSLLGVAEHLVGLVDQLEAVGGLGVLIDVRVELARQPTVGGLDLLLGGGPGDPECLVVVLVLGRSHGLLSDARNSPD